MTSSNQKPNHSKPRRQILHEMPQNAVCAEIGVWKGDYSNHILTITSPKRLHLIDPWEFQSEFPDRMYGGTFAKNQKDMDEIFQSVKDKFDGCTNVVINKGKSEEMLQDFPDGYLDWVYIDGNHYYEYVIKDLEICFKKVRSGGIIAGDDYYWGKEYGYPVYKAVQEFISNKRLKDRFRVIESQYLITL